MCFKFTFLLSHRSADFPHIGTANSLSKKLSECTHDVRMDFSLLTNIKETLIQENKSLRYEILAALCKSCFTLYS